MLRRRGPHFGLRAGGPACHAAVQVAQNSRCPGLASGGTSAGLPQVEHGTRLRDCAVGAAGAAPGVYVLTCSAGTRIPSLSLKPTAGLPPGANVYSTLMARPFP